MPDSKYDVAAGTRLSDGAEDTDVSCAKPRSALPERGGPPQAELIQPDSTFLNGNSSEIALNQRGPQQLCWSLFKQGYRSYAHLACGSGTGL